MPLYLIQAAYTSESWATQIRSQPNPMDRLKPLVEAAGGRLEWLYYAFGDYDIVMVTDMPDDETAAAVSLAASGGGAVRALKTTKLLTVEQGLSAMRKASKAGGAYQAPVGNVPQQGKVDAPTAAPAR
jgi:uncharacterized protein with GYD domain